MESCPTDPLARRHCAPCEGGVDKLTREQLEPLLAQVPLWQVDEAGDKIARKFPFRDFVTAMAFLQRVADVAEEEQHHPDLHLTGYRNVKIELTTHAIGGLSDNDFILAAKIDELAL